jgi:hypothetical protein
MTNLISKTNPYRGVRIVYSNENFSIFKQSICRLFLISAALLCTFSLSATVYYVSSSMGNDANSGTSISAPWKTLTKVNSFTPKPGDQILFKSGDSWKGTLTPRTSGLSGSPFVYGAYGTGAKPVITGFTSVTAWTNKGGNIWESTNAVSTLSTCNMVVINGVNTPMGREPNTGYYFFQSRSGNTQITSNNLTGTPNWTGAELAFNNSDYTIQRCPITAQSGGTLTFTQPESFTILENNLKFIIQNDIRTLNLQNEWYYNPSTKKISIYSTSQPTDVKVSTVETLVPMSGKNYVTIKDIEFTGANSSGVSLANSNYLTIDNCNFYFSGYEAINGTYSECSNFTIENCNINHSNNGAISINNYYPNATIRSNIITNTGMIYGAVRPLLSGINGSGCSTAINATSSGTTIEYNTIENTGYCGIRFLGSNVTVQKNFINNYCRVNHDGGGIYSYNGNNTTYSGTVVQHNIVLNSTTTAPGNGYEMDAGIYLDGYANGVEIAYNTVSAVSDYGIFPHGSHDVSVHHNNVFNCLKSMRFRFSRTSNINITNNTFIAKSSKQDIYTLDPAEDIISGIITDYNVMDRPIDSNALFETVIRTPTYSYKRQTLSNWKSYSGQDANSKMAPQDIISESDLQLEYNATNSSKTVSLGQPMIDMKGTKYAASITLQPYTSVILMKDANPDLSDVTKPVVTAFTIPSTSTSLVVAVSSLTASDNKAVTGFKLTETAVAPLAGEAGWSATAPVSYSFASEGTKTLYAWAKDAAGNVSKSVSTQVVITLTVNAEIKTLGNTEVYGSISTGLSRKAMPVKFNESGSITSISIYHDGGAGNVLLGVYADLSGLPSSQLGVTPSTVVKSTAGWQTVTLSSPVTVTAGQTVWLAWVFQNGISIRYTTGTPGRAISTATWSAGMPATFGSSSTSGTKYSIYCTFTTGTDLPDVTKPVVTDFTIPSTSASLLVSVTSFTASDDKAVSGYLLTESSTTPLAGNAGWTAAAPTSYSFATEGTKTLYAWAKDAAGNVSASVSDQVVISLPDVTKPVVTDFTIPSTSASLLVSVTSFTASDDKAVSGYLLTESSTTPLAGNAGWTAAAPTSYSFATEGTKTLYAWAKDAAGNVSASVSDQVVISLPDVTKPVVTDFTIPSTSASLLVSVTSFTASDDKAVSGYLLTESSTTPLAGNAGWTAAAPTSYSFATEGTKTLYAWAKDAAGNVSASVSDQVVISLPDVTKPVVTDFTIPSTSASLLVSVTSFTASDDKAVSGYLLTESSTTPLAGNAGWTAAAPTSYSFATEGTKTLYAWAKDAAGNVSASVSDQVVISLPDVTKPVVTDFTIPSTSASLLVSVTSFTASDDKAVSGYLLTESSTTPLAGNAGWTAAAPTSYSFATEGTKTLYAWAKDAAGNVSASVSDQVVISLPDVTKPVVTDFTIPSTSASLLVSVTSFTASDDKAVSGYLLTESSTTPLAGNAGWTAAAPTSYSFATEGTKTLYAWAKDAAGNVSASVSDQVVISLPDVTKPVVTDFTIPSTSASLLVSVTSFTASDDKAVSGYLLTESSTTPLAGNAGWTAAAPTSYSFATEGTKTLYAWAKDAAGNVSASVSDQVVISLPDVTKPVVTDFTIPSTSASLLVSVTSFTASDDKAVSGYLLTESSTTPLAGNAGWTAAAPTSYSFATEGTKTLYAWAKDAAGNVSASVSDQVVISLPDVTKPVVTDFTIPSTSASLLVSVTSFTASDDKAVSGYLLTESSTTPLAGNAGWTAAAPTSYSFATEGTKTLYAWAKDAAGNVSASVSDQVVISLPDVTKPVVTDFTIPSTSASLLVSVTSFTASDDKAVSGYLLTESSTTPLAGNAGWTAAAPTSYSFATEGTKTLYAWAKDAAGNVSASVSDQVVISLPDVTKPVVTDFTIPSTSASLLVSVTSFTASDDKAVSGYLLTESSTTPLAGNAGWTAAAPTSYSFATEGTKTLYAWAKDAAGNVSASVSDQVVISLPDVTKPVVTDFTIPSTSASLLVSVTSFTASDDKAVSGYLLTESSTTPLAGNAGWTAAAPTSYSFATEGTKTLYAWAKDAAGNVSASVSDQVVISLPDVTKPVVTDFTIPSTSASLLVSVTSFTASDDKAVSGYLLTESSTTPLAGNAGWTAAAPTSYSFATEGTKTLYAWAKDAAGNVSAMLFARCDLVTDFASRKEPKPFTAWAKDAAGNVSASVSDQVVISLPDVTKPVVTDFTIPSTSASLLVSVTSFTASDDKAVSGYLLTESSTTPLAGNAGWTAAAPTSYSFATEGTKTLYAWAKDAAGNVSASVSDQVVISLPDVTKPVVTDFTIPSTSASLLVSVTSFTASDDKAVSGYLLTESSTTPLAGNAGWTAAAPTSYSFATEGTKTLYAWAKDAAGNVSASVSDQVIIELIRPEIVEFSVPDTTESLTVPIIKFEVNDTNIVTGYIITETSSSPDINDTNWSPDAPNSYSFSGNETELKSVNANSDLNNDDIVKTLYAWTKCAGGNISACVSDQVVIALPDETKPVITSFSIPETSTSLAISFTSFTASDNKAVTGYLVTESSTTPLTGNAGWTASVPTSYTFATEGSKTLYAWAKDAAGNLSASVSDQVVITLPIDNKEPDIVINEVSIQSIELRKGWNIFSTFLVPENENMEAVMQTLVTAGKLIRVDDELGNTYLKQNNVTGWVNKIGNVQKTEGYKIRVTSDCLLEIKGRKISLPLSIEIKKGTNLISFPIDGSVDAMQLIQPLIDGGILDKVQDERGNSIENWRNTGWINGIGNFNEGEGYIVQALGDGVLTISEIHQKSGYLYAERFETSHFKVNYEGNGFDHMNINILDLDKTSLKIGDELAAFDNKICVGAIKLTEADFTNNAVSIPVSAAEISGVNGFTDGNQIVLKVWNNETNEESGIQIEATEGELIFNRYSSVFVIINENQVVNGLSDFDLLNINIYPNPANEVVNISFSNLPEIGTEIIIMDVNGREIVRRTIENMNETINIQHLPGGMYLVKIKLNNNFKIQKLIKN